MKAPETTAVAKAAKKHTSQAEEALAFIRDEGTIENVNDYRAAPKVIADLKAKRDALEAQRKEWTDPLNQVIKSIIAAFKPATEFYDEAEALLKERLAAFYHNQNEKRTKLLSGIAEIGDPEKRDLVMAEAAEAELPSLKGVSYRVAWTGEVVDVDALKADLIEHARWEFLTPDVKALQAHTKAIKGNPCIPGWHAFQKTVVAISKSLSK